MTTAKPVYRRPIKPAVSLPHKDDLAPLFEAAEAYRVATVAYHAEFDRLRACGMESPEIYAVDEIKSLSAEENRRLRACDEVRERINRRFNLQIYQPIFGLSCEGTLDDYAKQVRGSIRQKLERAWDGVNEETTRYLRRTFRTMPAVETFEVDMLVAEHRPMDVYRVDVAYKKYVAVTGLIEGKRVRIERKDAADYVVVDAKLARRMADVESHRKSVVGRADRLDIL